MASANPGKVTLISLKLKLLRDRGDLLIGVVEDYIKKIIVAGDSWAQGADNNLEYLELCHMIDAAIVLLCGKCEELTGTSEGIAANQISCQQQNMASQSPAATSSTPATSYRQPTAPLASTATTSYRQSTESVQPADGAHMKPVLDRIAVIEEAMCSFRSRIEKVAEHQSGIDQQLKELVSKLSESDKKHSSRFKQAKQHTSDISDVQDSIEGQKTRLQSLEKQLQEISTAQNRQQTEIKKLVHAPYQLESVKDNFDALDDRIDGIVDDCINKHKDIETVTRDVADKVMANTQSVQLISEGQAQNTTLLRELQTRLQTLEADGGRNVKDVQKQAEKGETNFRILCQMLNDRLRPLEQLRSYLNERASKRDDNVTKLSQLIKEVAVMSPRLQQLEMKSSRTRCGFTAWKSFTGEVASYTIIRHYNTTTCNLGQDFNADSGIFTAPVDGLYVASISLCLSENEHLSVDVEYKQSMDTVLFTRVCGSSAATKKTSCCGVGVVDMKAGEVLLLRVHHIEKNNCDKIVSFSCFLLG